MKINESILNALRQITSEWGSQIKLAKTSKVSNRLISKYLSGKISPDIKVPQETLEISLKNIKEYIKDCSELKKDQKREIILRLQEMELDNTP